MGKHKHSKDKLYILQSEYRRDALIRKQQKSKNVSFLPFNYCCISLKPFKEPYCDEDGKLYDKTSVLEEMSKPETNKKVEKKIDIKKLIKVNFYKHNNEYICPVTRKYFNRHTKIILNKKTGNVYSSEIFKLFENKDHMFDPITHDHMTKSDLIVLQDPLKNKNDDIINNVNESYVQKGDKKSQSIGDNGAIMSILKEVKGCNTSMTEQDQSCFKNEITTKQVCTKKKGENSFIPSYNSSNNGSDSDNNEHIEDESSSENEIKIKCEHVSDNKLAQSVTSTISNITYQNSFAYLPENKVYDLIYENVKKKKKNSYIRIITDIGMINIELYTCTYPKLCHNFLFLCEYKYYNNTDIFKKDKLDFIIYFGANKINSHLAASGFYWKKKIKKYKLKKKINDETVIQKLKEKIMNVKSDDDSDVAIKYVQYNKYTNTETSKSFGKIFMSKYYNQKYSNMFYICLADEYETSDICIGKVVGGNETLEKLANVDPTINHEVRYKLKETIIYTNPFKDVIKEMKVNLKKKPEKDLNENKDNLINDDTFEENKNDDIGKYIKWKNLKKKNTTNLGELNKPKLNISQLNAFKKDAFPKSKQNKMDFSCW
ncbi:peptidyl-prolyl cis-trans isomerase [Hepatocystis sp. ex Piliocolobus tephrosceles]|nr:peptidyl-prolyl cis-trans isomerase [Hepatocystis sp. ex Piliocolobus tephrosceles]